MLAVPDSATVPSMGNSGGPLAHVPGLILLWREEAGLTQRELAEKIGMSPANVSGWERGTSGMKLSTLSEIMGALGKTASDLSKGLAESPSLDRISAIEARIDRMDRRGRGGIQPGAVEKRALEEALKLLLEHLTSGEETRVSEPSGA